MILCVCEGSCFAWLKVSAHASALGSEAALAAAPGPDLVSSLPGNKGPPLPPLPNQPKWNEMERKGWIVKGREYENGKWGGAGADLG